MSALAVLNVVYSYADQPVLSECSLSIDHGQRLGIVGRNGSGKTTLLKILASHITPDKGSLSKAQGLRLGYLHQQHNLTPGLSLIKEAHKAFDWIKTLKSDLEDLYDQAAHATGDALNKILKKQAQLQQQIESAGGYALGHRINATLHGLGFFDREFDIPVQSLSGGQQARLALAKLLLAEPDILLMDEPTNHLDIQGRIWLENFLRDTYKGAVVLIAHDRALLNHVVDRIVEVEHGKLYDYPGNFDSFLNLRKQRLEVAARAYDKQQDNFKRQEAFIRKYKTGQRAKQARGRQSILDRERAEHELDAPPPERTMSLRLPPAPPCSQIILTAQDLSKSYQQADGSTRTLFNNLSIKVSQGERWGIIGPNGAGKTTLVNCLLDNISPDSGSVRLGSRLSIGSFSQSQDHLDPEKTVCRFIQDAVRKENPDLDMSEQHARDLAGAFLFSGRDQDKALGEISGGERARATLAALMASAKNVLILDEPTNHLDIPSAQRLEESLSSNTAGGFTGTLILISHDRALINATCDHLIVLDGKGNHQLTLGNHDDWIRHQSVTTKPISTVTQENHSPLPTTSTPNPKAEKSKSNPFSWMSDEVLENKIHQLEINIAAVDQKLADPEAWTDAKLMKTLTLERQSINADLEPLENEWLHRAED